MDVVSFKVDFSARGHNYLEEAMKYADLLTQGKYLKEFEDKFSKFNGSKNCFAVIYCSPLRNTV